MKKAAKVKLSEAKDIESIELRSKAARQIQQELLEKKLLGFLSPIEDEARIEQYPQTMQLLIMEFIQKAEKQMKP